MQGFMDGLLLSWVQLMEWWQMFWDTLFNRPEDLFWALIDTTIVQ